MNFVSILHTRLFDFKVQGARMGTKIYVIIELEQTRHESVGTSSLILQTV